MQSKKILKLKGFTLTELLVVVLIIAALSAIALPLYNRAIERSRASDALRVITLAATKQETFFFNNGRLAESFSELGAIVHGLKGTQSTIGSFEYTMLPSCITARRLTNRYTIFRSFETNEEACFGPGCGIIRNMLPEVKELPEGCIACEAYGAGVQDTKLCKELRPDLYMDGTARYICEASCSGPVNCKWDYSDCKKHDCTPQTQEKPCKELDPKYLSGMAMRVCVCENGVLKCPDSWDTSKCQTQVCVPETQKKPCKELDPRYTSGDAVRVCTCENGILKCPDGWDISKCQLGTNCGDKKCDEGWTLDANCECQCRLGCIGRPPGGLSPSANTCFAPYGGGKQSIPCSVINPQYKSGEAFRTCDSSCAGSANCTEWDISACSAACTPITCTGGQVFDQATCKCKCPGDTVLQGGQCKCPGPHKTYMLPNGTCVCNPGYFFTGQVHLGVIGGIPGQPAIHLDGGCKKCTNFGYDTYLWNNTSGTSCICNPGRRAINAGSLYQVVCTSCPNPSGPTYPGESFCRCPVPKQVFTNVNTGQCFCPWGTVYYGDTNTCETCRNVNNVTMIQPVRLIEIISGYPELIGVYGCVN